MSKLDSTFCFHVFRRFSNVTVFAGQAQDAHGDGEDLGGGDGHRVLLRGGDGLRVADAAQDRRPPHRDDPHLVPESLRRVLPHPGAGLPLRQLQVSAGATPALHHPPLHRHHFRYVKTPPRGGAFRLSSLNTRFIRY